MLFQWGIEFSKKKTNEIIYVTFVLWLNDFLRILFKFLCWELTDSSVRIFFLNLIIHKEQFVDYYYNKK